VYDALSSIGSSAILTTGLSILVMVVPAANGRRFVFVVTHRSRR
jgi:hypothetical protein